MSKFFADAEESFEESKFVIYGYPYDGTACFRKGTAKAPDAIREQSFNFETNLMELGVDLVDVPANDWGNIELGKNQEENNSRIKSLVSEIISNNKFPIGLGGEHSLTPPVIEAMVEKYPNLNWLFIEVDNWWIPGLLWHFDADWKALREYTPWVKRLPSEYFRQHIRVGTQPLQLPPGRADAASLFKWMYAEEILVYASDFPHWDWDEPNPTAARFPQDIRDAVFGLNAKDLLRID